MGTFGNEFINLGVGSGNARDASDPGARSIAIGDALRTLARLGGGYLYFPPGVYSLATGFTVSENVTLYFSPGAYLIPGLDPRFAASRPADARLSTDIEVYGSILAGRHQIVMSPYWPVRRDHVRLIDPDATIASTGIQPNDELVGMGRLLILGNQVLEVFPEWFGAQPFMGDDAAGLFQRYDLQVGSRVAGAQPMDFVDATAALQAALDCAHRQRGLLEHELPALPVVLSGRYLVSKALRVGLRDADDATTAFGQSLCKPFVLRGPSGPGARDVPALRPHSNYPRMPYGPKDSLSAVFNPDATLLHVDGPTGFLIDGVAFSGRAVDADPSMTGGDASHQDLRVHSCLRIERRQSQVDAPLHELREMDRLEGLPISRVVRCNFADTRGCLVQLGAWEHPNLYAAAHVFDGSWRQDLGTSCSMDVSFCSA